MLRTPAEVAAEPLTVADDWRVLADIARGVLAAPDTAVPTGYARDGWSHRCLAGTVDRHRDRGLVTVTSDGRRRLTDAGWAHYAAHHADYAHSRPGIAAPAPADRSAQVAPGQCGAAGVHEWHRYACTLRAGHHGDHKDPAQGVRWPAEGGPVSDLQGRPLLRGTPPPPRRAAADRGLRRPGTNGLVGVLGDGAASPPR
ncbi:hypothetical protein ABZ801_34825 [Actinomadura sp. NPDC047616]|uniref:hypothetical protein n=1 Tax=Actinomadura sp. NPDC047616 TaxID=3155914 RepID=UPI0033EA886C